LKRLFGDNRRLAFAISLPLFPHGHFLNKMLEEKPAHHPLEPLDVALKHTGLDAACLLVLAHRER
jgi:hypothetical protein